MCELAVCSRNACQWCYLAAVVLVAASWQHRLSSQLLPQQHAVGYSYAAVVTGVTGMMAVSS